MEKSTFKKFDGYVIPSHLSDLTYVKQSEPIRYWMVELTLTSGNVLSFYVKAKTKLDALKLAEENSFLAELSHLIPTSNKLVLKY